MESVFLDSLVFIAIAKHEDEFKAVAGKLLYLIDTGKIRAYASVVSLLELSHVLKREKFSDLEINHALHSVLSIGNITFLPMTTSIVKHASDLILSYKSGFYDAIIASTMAHNEMTKLVSEDDDFDVFPFLQRFKIRDVI